LLLCALYYRAFIGDREKVLSDVAPAAPTARRGAPLVASR
jgi:hypothetical protein